MACSKCLVSWQISQTLSGQLLTNRSKVYTALAPPRLLQSGPAEYLMSGVGVATSPRTCKRFRILAAKKKGGSVNKAAAAKKEKEAAEAAAKAAQNAAPYKDPDVFLHSLLLIDSYQRATGKPLFTNLDLADAGRALFEAPFVCVSHNAEADPIFDYGNKAGLDLFEMTWDEFTKTPSQRSAAADASEQDARNKLLEEALEKGAVELSNLQRLSSTGKPIAIKKGLLWSVTNLEGERLGQAAILEPETEASDTVSSDESRTVTSEEDDGEKQSPIS